VVADYGQVEPRVAADFAQEPSLIKTFLEERDIYTALADPFGLTRAAGKIIFLSVAYGTGPHKLATTVGIPLADAEKIINVDFPRRFKRLAENKRDVIRTARAMKDPYVITPLGRRRYLPELRSSDSYKRDRAGRQAYNFLIQGTAADINKQAMANWWQIAPDEWKLVLNVHDELVVRVPEDDAKKAAALLQECMTGVKMLNTVPLVADAKICDSWDEGKN
jgi:DNA polymerase-1